jgi:hypothetical protein
MPKPIPLGNGRIASAFIAIWQQARCKIASWGILRPAWENLPD